MFQLHNVFYYYTNPFRSVGYIHVELHILKSYEYGTLYSN